MLLVLFASLGLVASTMLIHYEILRLLHAGLPRFSVPRRSKLLVAVLAVFSAHALEIACFGVALYLLVSYAGVGSLQAPAGSALTNCFYFSAETFTSLGFGDLVPIGPVRLWWPSSTASS